MMYAHSFRKGIKLKNKYTSLFLKKFILILIYFGFSSIISSTNVYADEGRNYQSFLENKTQEYFEGQSIQWKSNDTEPLQIENQKNNSIDIYVQVEGLYFLNITYKIPNQSILPTKISLLINDEVQYKELSNLSFKSLWIPEKEVTKDRYGNELSPEVKKSEATQTNFLYDSNGYDENPLAVYMKKGKNKLVFKSIEGNLSIFAIELLGKDEVKDFHISKDKESKVSGANYVTVEGEAIYQQNSTSIRANASFNSRLTPSNSSKKVLNFLDGASFSNVGDQVFYKLDVPEKGEYYLNLHYQQDAKIDFPVYLTIAVNDQILSDSLQAQPIPYSSKFSNYTILNKQTKEKLPIKLNKGENSISFKIVASPIGYIMQRTAEIVKEMQNLSLDIDNLLGSNQDKTRDIDLEDYLPGTQKKIKAWADEIQGFRQEVRNLANTSKDPGAFSAFSISESQLRSLLNEPRKLANRKNELSKDSGSVAETLSTLLQEAANNAISIDQIQLYQTKEPITKKVSIFKQMAYGLKRFTYSFKNQDYEVTNDSQNLQVWVNRPRQYVELMQQMVDQEFTKKTGIKVDLSIMPDQNKLILANASGTAPDVALGVNYALPFDMGIRDALVDLSEFKNFDELSSEFNPNLLIPASIGDSVYAMPETMNFYVLFYRKDILESLGLSVPNTMKDVVAMLPNLNQRGMSVFYPTATLGVSFKGFPWTMPIVYQSGGDFYTEDILSTGLNTDETVNGLKNLSDLFTIYNLPKDVPSFFQQFRDGSLPIGVADFGSYNMILNAAPEISNLWNISLVPGYENDEGEVERWTSGGAESAVMFKSTTNKQNSWDFMQWWLDSQTQKEFGIELQTTFGDEYIWNTANLKAFNELPWATKDKNIILEQSKWVMEVPRVLGSYMVEREVSNVYNSVVVDGVNLRKAIDLSTKRINRETERKLEEFGYFKNGKLIKEYPFPKLVEEGVTNEQR